MFFHVKELQYDAKPDMPNPVYAKRLQELLGGKFGEMTVMMTYLFQAGNCRGPQKYRDMLFDIGTEEIAHVEMLATMIARLLETAPVNEQEDTAQKIPVVGAVLGGTDPREIIFSAMNPQHEIVTGQGAAAKDSVGNPWSGAFVASSGNLLADFRYNLMAQSQGNLQASRLYQMTDDTGVRNMLSRSTSRGTSCTRTSGRQQSKSCSQMAFTTSSFQRHSRSTGLCSRTPTLSGTFLKATRAKRGAGLMARHTMVRVSSSTWPVPSR